MKKKLTLCALSAFLGLAVAAYPQDVNTEGTDAEAYELEEDPIEQVKQHFESIGMEYPLKDAYTDYDNKNFDKMLFDADMVLSVFPLDIEARFLKGSAYLGKLDYKNAMVYYMPLYMQELDSRVPNIIWTIAKNDPALVLDLFEKNIKKVGDDEDSKPLKLAMYDCIGYCYRMLGQNRKAASEIFPTALMLTDDEDNKVYESMSIAVSWLKVGDGAEAYRILDSLNPSISDNDVTHLKALALREQNKMPEAIALLKKTLADQALDLDLASDLGSFLTVTGQYDEAKSIFNSALDSLAAYDEYMDDDYFIAHKADLILRRGIISQLKGDEENAKKDFEAVLALGDTGYELNARARLGRIDEIEKLFLEEPGFDPLGIAALYGAANLPEKAMPYLEKAFELQQITPTALKYDINLMNMQKAPGYAEAVKYFDPSK